jgi:hypothetical protein
MNEKRVVVLSRTVLQFNENRKPTKFMQGISSNFGTRDFNGSADMAF